MSTTGAHLEASSGHLSKSGFFSSLLFLRREVMSPEEAIPWVLGSGFWVLGSGFWVLGSGFWVLGSGVWGLGSKTSPAF